MSPSAPAGGWKPTSPATVSTKPIVLTDYEPLSIERAMVIALEDRLHAIELLHKRVADGYCTCGVQYPCPTAFELSKQLAAVE